MGMPLPFHVNGGSEINCLSCSSRINPRHFWVLQKGTSDGIAGANLLAVFSYSSVALLLESSDMTKPWI